MNNFSTLVTFIAGLQNSSIERLKWTQNEVPAKVKKLLNELSGEIGPVRGYQQLRMALNSLTLPAIPFIGLYLADVTFVQYSKKTLSSFFFLYLTFLKSNSKKRWKFGCIK